MIKEDIVAHQLRLKMISKKKHIVEINKKVKKQPKNQRKLGVIIVQERIFKPEPYEPSEYEKRIMKRK